MTTALKIDAPREPGVRAQLGVSDFERVLGTTFSPWMRERVASEVFEYRNIDGVERDALVLRILDALLDPTLPTSGPHRLNDWEQGWGENLDRVVKGQGVDGLAPGYFDKFRVVRFDGGFIQPLSPRFEQRSLAVIVDWLADRFCRDASSLYEFGCGTGHHLVRLAGINPKAKLWGLDWATSSQGILARISQERGLSALRGHRFNYFEPDTSFTIDPNGVAYTVASLEQVGDRWEPFVEYLLAQRPALCIHVEPIAELLDPTRLLDRTSQLYFEKRNYLKGFLTGLRALEKAGRLRIREAQRTHIGSLMIEGYSVIVWEPV